MKLKKLAKYWSIYILLAVAVPLIWPLLMPGYFSHHDDLQVMRIFEMNKCIKDLQIPCRWVPDLGYGNGYPLFNFYSAFPYYVGGILSFIFGFIQSAKLLFFIPLVFGGLSMYLLVRELTNKTGGLIGGALYLLAPYRALDSYARGDVAESFALSLIPLVFYLLLKLNKSPSFKNFFWSSLVFGFFLLSHNIMTIYFLPIIIVWNLYWSIKFKGKSLMFSILSLSLGFGISAFFLIPAFFEKELVQVDNLTKLELDFRAHFVTIKQMFFSRFWGYGASVPGASDTLSFQIGWPHWLLVIGVGFLALSKKLGILKGKYEKNETFIVVVFFSLIFLISIFMMHTRSAFIWEKIPILRFSQFPWRFLSLGIFSSSIIAGYVAVILNGKKLIFITSLILTLAFILNVSYFKPREFYPNLTDNDKLSGGLWEIQQKASILDYLPKTAYEPKEPAPTLPIIKSGDTKIINFNNYSNKWQFEATVFSPSEIEVPVFDFPNWQVTANGNAVIHSHKNYLGRISFYLLTGKYQIKGVFENTPIRTISNIISGVSLLALLLIFIYGKNNKRFF